MSGAETLHYFSLKLVAFGLGLPFTHKFRRTNRSRFQSTTGLAPVETSSFQDRFLIEDAPAGFIEVERCFLR